MAFRTYLFFKLTIVEQSYYKLLLQPDIAVISPT